VTPTVPAEGSSGRGAVEPVTAAAAGECAPVGRDWSAWLSRHGAALVLLARQWARDRADAEDVVQEAFVRFWRSRERAEDPRAYLFACVKTAAMDGARGQRRRQAREQAVARESAAADAVEPTPMFTDEPTGAVRRAEIEAAMAALPAEQREVLVMKIWGGLTFPQIGAALEISPNTAASRYRYALEGMRRRLPVAESQRSVTPCLTDRPRCRGGY
jgi:RNA polymerase sigma-70 factor (ECF subfamily)